MKDHWQGQGSSRVRTDGVIVSTDACAPRMVRIEAPRAFTALEVSRLVERLPKGALRPDPAVWINVYGDLDHGMTVADEDIPLPRVRVKHHLAVDAVQIQELLTAGWVVLHIERTRGASPHEFDVLVSRKEVR